MIKVTVNATERAASKSSIKSKLFHKRFRLIQAQMQKKNIIRLPPKSNSYSAIQKV